MAETFSVGVRGRIGVSFISCCRSSKSGETVSARTGVHRLAFRRARLHRDRKDPNPHRADTKVVPLWHGKRLQPLSRMHCARSN